MAGGVIQRKRNSKGRTNTDFTSHLNGATMSLDALFDNRQTQPSTRDVANVSATVKGAKELGLVSYWNTHPLILNLKNNFLRFSLWLIR